MVSQAVIRFLMLWCIQKDSRRPERIQRSPSASSCRLRLTALSLKPCGGHSLSADWWGLNGDGSMLCLAHAHIVIVHSHTQRDTQIHAGNISQRTYCNQLRKHTPTALFTCLCHIHCRVNRGSAGYQQESRVPSRSRNHGNY